MLLPNSPDAPAKLSGISKRKRDGVFYTPRYITTYIVENTVGRLCAVKKAELGLVEAVAAAKPAAKPAAKAAAPAKAKKK